MFFGDRYHSVTSRQRWVTSVVVYPILGKCHLCNSKLLVLFTSVLTAFETPHFLLRVTPSHSVVPSGHVTIPAWSQGIAKWQPHRSSVGPPPKKGSVIFWLCRDSWSFAVAVWHRGDSNVQRFHPYWGESFGKSRGASYCDMQRHATQC